jgi:hypothetical protein
MLFSDTVGNTLVQRLSGPTYGTADLRRSPGICLAIATTQTIKATTAATQIKTIENMLSGIMIALLILAQLF